MGWEENATEYYKLCDLHINTDIVLNTGVLVLQPKIHADFLQKIYDKYIIQSITHYRKFHFEQSCIGYELQTTNTYVIIDNKFNAIWGLTKFKKNNNIGLEDFFKQNYFIHFAGRVDFNKVVYLNKINK